MDRQEVHSPAAAIVDDHGELPDQEVEGMRCLDRAADASLEAFLDGAGEEELRRYRQDRQRGEMGV